MLYLYSRISNLRSLTAGQSQASSRSCWPITILLSKLIENILTWSYENFKVNQSCTCTDRRQKCLKRHNTSGHKCVWAQTCVGTIVCGHNRVWAQPCLGTIVCGHNRVSAQTCLGTIVWAQSCMGPIVVEPVVRCFIVHFSYRIKSARICRIHHECASLYDQCVHLVVEL